MTSTKGKNKTMKGMLALVALAVALMAPQAYAQDTELEGPPAPAVKAEATVEGAEQIETALAEIEAELALLAAVTDVSPEQIEVIAVHDLVATDADAAMRVTEAVTAKNEQILTLREALAAHAAVAEALAAAEVTTDQVIAVRVVETPKLVIFYQ